MNDNWLALYQSCDHYTPGLYTTDPTRCGHKDNEDEECTFSRCPLWHTYQSQSYLSLNDSYQLGRRVAEEGRGINECNPYELGTEQWRNFRYGWNDYWAKQDGDYEDD